MVIYGFNGNDAGVNGYAARELQRIFHGCCGRQLPSASAPPAAGADWPADDLVLLGDAAMSAMAQNLLQEDLGALPDKPQGYLMRLKPHRNAPGRRVLAIIGHDAVGALYALRDLEHYHLPPTGGIEAIAPFRRIDYPRIAHRGHWTWGCNMPDKLAWIENMSRWKLNELIHWDNFPPVNAREIVAFAHERGVRVIWGFGWGWMPQWNFKLPSAFDRGSGDGVDMCSSSQFNQRFFHREILRKIREVYAPTGCDGVYFQSFTECPKCGCTACAGKTMGELMLDFVNPLVAAIKEEFPRLWISCGIHHDFGDFSHLRHLDPRCNIYWENCPSGASLRDDDNEDFGYIYKSIHYGAGYSAMCPADPPYTEDSLRAWMESNGAQYQINGGLPTHYQYMRQLQHWARQFEAKPSPHKHASVVADHSVFCRRTPFPHAALAEAQWNCDLDTEATVDGILRFLNLYDNVAARPEPKASLPDYQGMPPWLCRPA